MSFANALRTFHQRHEALKKFVHEGMRYPLPPIGQKIMGFVYFTIPVIGGCAIMKWAIGKSHESIGLHGEKLPLEATHLGGNKTIDEHGRAQTVGAGGWGGGVRLAVSDEETQRRNQKRLRKFLRRQKKKMEQESGEN